MLESKIQAKIIKKLEAEGWYCIKIVKCNKSGIPDILALKNGIAKFIEVKQEKGVISEIQKFRIKELQEQGFEVNVWKDYEKKM